MRPAIAVAGFLLLAALAGSPVVRGQDDGLGPGGVKPLVCDPGSRCERKDPPEPRIPPHLRAVHASFVFRVSPDVAEAAGLDSREQRLLEAHVARLREHTPASLTRWSGMLRKEITLDDDGEARLHRLLLEWEAENASLRIVHQRGAMDAEELAYKLQLNNEVLLAAVQAEISQELFEYMANMLRYPSE